MLDEPGNDMIVLPFRYRYPSLGMIAMRTEEHFIFVARDVLAIDDFPPGSCIQ